MNIDIVYCWCDLSDDSFRKRKQELAANYDVNSQANNDCRFTDNDELKYSLRSIDKYASWINNIFVITDNQCPKWLNIDNPKVHLIDIRDFMPKDAIPCFNSNSIEHCICDIAELSEYFLYACDDMFLTGFVEPDFFYKNGYPICRYERGHLKKEFLYDSALCNADDLVFKKYKIRIGRYPHHNIDAYRKSDLRQCKQIFKKEIEKTIYSPFRTSSDIQRSIYLDYAIAIKHGYFKEIRCIDTWFPFYKKLIYKIFDICSKESLMLSLAHGNIIETLVKYRPKLLCLNDDELSTNKDRELVKLFLECMYPEKSQFEK